MKTDKELYEGSVWQWMKYLVKHWLSYPSGVSKRQVLEAIATAGVSILWLLLILTLPISAPIMAIIGRRIHRRQFKAEYERIYGE